MPLSILAYTYYYVCNGVTQTLWLTNQLISKMLSVLVPGLPYIFLCWSTSAFSLKWSEETICASGRLTSHLYPSCSAGRIRLHTKVGVCYTYNNSNKIFEWAKYIWMLANIQIYKYLTVSPSSNNNIEVLRTLMRRNTPRQTNGDLHVWPGSQYLLIPKLHRVGQA